MSNIQNSLTHGIVHTTAQQFTPYYIIARHSGKALDVVGGNIYCGAKLQQSELYYETHQQFFFDSKWCLISVASGLAVDVFGYCEGDDNEASNNLIMLDRTGESNQQWTYKNGLLISCCNSKALDVQDASKENGATVYVWPQHGQPNQKWDLVPVYAGKPPIFKHC